MKLRKVHVREYKSIWDSNEFEIDRVACLVGKNEAGKTALLEALYRLNPIVAGDGNFDVTDDYPRVAVENYQQDVESKRRKQAVVIEATFALEQAELDTIAGEYGTGALKVPEARLWKGYAQENGKCGLYFDLPINEPAIVAHLVENYGLPEPTKAKAAAQLTLAQLGKYLDDEAARHAQAVTAAEAAANKLEGEAEKAAALEKSKSLEESEQAKALRTRVAELRKHATLSKFIWDTHLHAHLPKFLYFNEYYQMRGHDNVEALKKRQADGKLEPPDHPLLGLIELARLDLNQLLAVQRTQDLKNKLQGASNHLSQQVLDYWSQNKHLEMHFDVRPALPADPEGMREGMNIWGDVYDSKHKVSTSLGTRSRGFVWFFSFLAWYSAEKKKDEALVLLLDEPGLSLHGRAQGDLLDYFEKEVVTNPKHQLIYTTHSPFMVDPQRFDRVRIVQDKGIDTDKKLPREEDGTKVFTDVLEAGPDSLFPLQGALGYEIYQTLFIGPNCLIVEGVSDLLDIQTISGVLSGLGRTALDPRWTITPVGGADKVPTFVALIGAQKSLRLATLVDFQTKDKQMLENLYKKKLLEMSHVRTFADFTKTAEADIEDMFDVDFYLRLVNEEYAKDLSSGKIKEKDLTTKHPRVLVRLEKYFEANPLKAGKFNHYRPARHFSEKVASLGKDLSADTLARFEEAFTTLNALLPAT